MPATPAAPASMQSEALVSSMPPRAISVEARASAEASWRHERPRPGLTSSPRTRFSKMGPKRM